MLQIWVLNQASQTAKPEQCELVKWEGQGEPLPQEDLPIHYLVAIWHVDHYVFLGPFSSTPLHFETSQNVVLTKKINCYILIIFFNLSFNFIWKKKKISTPFSLTLCLLFELKLNIKVLKVYIFLFERQYIQ